MASKAPPTGGWRSALSMILLLGGVVLLLVSFFLPASMLGNNRWSTEDAKRYQAASVKLHSLSHSAVHAKPAEQQQMRKDLAQAQTDYETVRQKLDSAIAIPKRTFLALRILGGLLLIVGAVGAYLTRSPGDVQ